MIANALLLRQNSPALLLFWSVIGFAVGVALFFYGFVLLKQRRLILDTPSSKIRSAPMGLVEVSGLACGPYTLLAPVTARQCYFYRTIVWELQKAGKSSQWVKVAGECIFVPFFLDDNTGRVLVDPRGAELDLHRDFEGEFSNSFFTTLDPAPANVTAFLARRGVSTHNKLKVEEFCIKPKNALFILGTMAQNSGLMVAPKPIEDIGALGGVSGSRFSLNVAFAGNSAENDIDQSSFAQYMAKASPAESSSNSSAQSLPGSAQPQVMRLSSGSVAPLRTSEMTQQQRVAAALMKAGISNPAAWSAAGVEVPAVQVVTDKSANSAGGNGFNGDANSSAQSSTEANGYEVHPPVVLKRGANDRSFLISWRSQRELASALGWKCTAMIWGGAALALVALYLFLSIEAFI